MSNLRNLFTTINNCLVDESLVDIKMNGNKFSIKTNKKIHISRKKIILELLPKNIKINFTVGNISNFQALFNDILHRIYDCKNDQGKQLYTNYPMNVSQDSVFETLLNNKALHVLASNKIEASVILLFLRYIIDQDISYLYLIIKEGFKNTSISKDLVTSIVKICFEFYRINIQ